MRPDTSTIVCAHDRAPLYLDMHALTRPMWCRLHVHRLANERVRVPLWAVAVGCAVSGVVGAGMAAIVVWAAT